VRARLACLGAIALGAIACGKSTSSGAPASTSAASEPSSSSASQPLAASAAPVPLEACEPLVTELPELMTVGDDPPVPPIEYPGEGGDAALAKLFEKMARLLRGKAKDHIRIGVYGDSNGTADYMTGEMRRVLQTKYGDAGHGFLAVGRPWTGYLHRWVKTQLQVDTWESYTVTTKPTPDTLTGTGWYGHAMITAQSLQGNAQIWLGTADESAPIGQRVSKLEIFYLKWPRGGPFDVKVDGELKSTVDTNADTAGAGFEVIDVPDGPHKFTLASKKSERPVRFFGVTFTRDTQTIKPSFQVDGLGVGSLNCLTMSRDLPETFVPTVQRRNYDLVIFHTGSNTFNGDLPACMKGVIERHKKALPDAVFMILTPPDSKESLDLLKTCDDMKTSAKESNIAFFDFRVAMGGEDSMKKFSKLDMCGDGLHFNAKGGAYMGDRVLYALWKAFMDWLAKNPRAGCGVSDAPASSPNK
jgi:hypothetical protein